MRPKRSQRHGQQFRLANGKRPDFEFERQRILRDIIRPERIFDGHGQRRFIAKRRGQQRFDRKRLYE